MRLARPLFACFRQLLAGSLRTLYCWNFLRARRLFEVLRYSPRRLIFLVGRMITPWLWCCVSCTAFSRATTFVNILLILVNRMCILLFIIECVLFTPTSLYICLILIWNFEQCSLTSLTWDDLPSDVTSAESLSTLRQRLKTRLFFKSFPRYFPDF